MQAAPWNPPTVERADVRWVANIVDDAALRPSAERLRSGVVARRLAESTGRWFYGDGPWELHEGGLWLVDADGWFCVRNVLGIDPAGLAALDPARVDELRRTTRRVYARFPEAAGRLQIRSLLDHPIRDARDVRRWVDSICNANLPMPRRVHSAALPEGPGIDHYPTPVVDIEFLRRDDFRLWVNDAAGNLVALAPMPDAGEGAASVQWAEPGTTLGVLQRFAAENGMLLLLDGGLGGRITLARRPDRPAVARTPPLLVPGGPLVGTHPWARYIAARPPRTMSAEYRRTRQILDPVIAAAPPLLYDRGDPGRRQVHHGGGLWLKDEEGWFMVRNLAGMEWSAQFCADPAKVDLLRRNARRLYQRFPEAVDELQLRPLLDQRIRTAADVSRFCDSVLNASMPLSPTVHSGTLPGTAGYHMYPARVVELQFVKRRQFQLFLAASAALQQADAPPPSRRPGRDGLG